MAAASDHGNRSSTGINPTLLQPNEYKVILIGAVGVGKTSLLMRYVHNEFQDTPNKFVAEERKTININGKDMVLYLWDTAGQERYQSITQRFYYNTSAVMIVYDITDVESYNEATKNWFTEATSYLEPSSLNIPIILVGNKLDLDSNRAIQFKEAKEFCSRNNLLPPIECSAKLGGDKVKKAFECLGKEISSRNLKPKESSDTHVTSVTRRCC